MERVPEFQPEEAENLFEALKRGEVDREAIAANLAHLSHLSVRQLISSGESLDRPKCETETRVFSAELARFVGGMA